MLIIHHNLILFKIKDNIADKEQETDNFIIALRKLLDKIASIQTLEVAQNINPNPIAHDVILITEFNNSEGLNSYAQHSAYSEITEHWLRVTTDRGFVDYDYS